MQLDPTGVSFAPYRTERLSRGVLYDMAVDPAGGRAVVVGADGQLRLFDVATGRAIRNFSGDPGCGERNKTRWRAVRALMCSTGVRARRVPERRRLFNGAVAQAHNAL